MKFLCLIYHDEAERDAIPAEQWEPLMQQGFDDAEELGAQGADRQAQDDLLGRLQVRRLDHQEPAQLLLGLSKRSVSK